MSPIMYYLTFGSLMQTTSTGVVGGSVSSAISRTFGTDNVDRAELFITDVGSPLWRSI